MTDLPPKPEQTGRWGMDENGDRAWLHSCHRCKDTGFLPNSFEKGGTVYEGVHPCICPLGRWMGLAWKDQYEKFDTKVEKGLIKLRPEGDLGRERTPEEEDRLIRKGIAFLTKWPVPDDVDTETALKVGKEIFLGKRAVPAEDEPLDWRSE